MNEAIATAMIITIVVKQILKSIGILLLLSILGALIIYSINNTN